MTATYKADNIISIKNATPGFRIFNFCLLSFLISYKAVLGNSEIDLFFYNYILS